MSQEIEQKVTLQYSSNATKQSTIRSSNGAVNEKNNVSLMYMGRAGGSNHDRQTYIRYTLDKTTNNYSKISFDIKGRHQNTFSQIKSSTYFYISTASDFSIPSEKTSVSVFNDLNITGSIKQNFESNKIYYFFLYNTNSAYGYIDYRNTDQNGDESSAPNPIFTFSDIKYEMSLPKNEKEGYTFNPITTSVREGETFEFEFIWNPNKYSEITLNSSSGTLVKNGNTYTITNVSSDTTITINKKTLNTYKIILPSENERIGYTITESDPTSVAYGSKFSLRIKIKEGYMKNSNFAVESGGIPLTEGETTPLGTLYTLKNITSDQTITITGIIQAGLVYISNGSNYSKYLCYIYDNKQWKKVMPMIYDNNWHICS